MEENIQRRNDDEIIRDMIEKENEFINHRITWLTTVEGLFFAALGFIWDKAGAEELIILICALGIMVAIVALSGVLGATKAMVDLYSWWENNKPKNYLGPAVIGLMPSKKKMRKYITPWNLLPFIFIVAWLAVLLIILCQIDFIETPAVMVH